MCDVLCVMCDVWWWDVCVYAWCSVWCVMCDVCCVIVPIRSRLSVCVCLCLSVCMWHVICVDIRNKTEVHEHGSPTTVRCLNLCMIHCLTYNYQRSDARSCKGKSWQVLFLALTFFNLVFFIATSHIILAHTCIHIHISPSNITHHT